MENTSKAQRKDKGGPDHLRKLVEDLGHLVEDIRLLLEERPGGPAEKEGAIRGALHRVRDLVRGKPQKAAEERQDVMEAEPAAEAPEPPAAAAAAEPPKTEAARQPPDPPKSPAKAAGASEPPKPPAPQADQDRGADISRFDLAKDRLSDVITRLGHTYEALGGVVTDLKSAVEGKLTGNESALRTALGKARQVVEGAIRREPQATAVSLFDGSDESFQKWRLVGSGWLDHEGGELRLKAGPDRGLVYFTERRFDDLTLRLQFRPSSPDFEMSAAVRFLDPEQPVPDRDDPSILYPYDNQSFIAIHTGFEVRLGAERPGAEPGTVEGVLIGDQGGAQIHTERGEVKPDDWNDLEVTVQGNEYVVRLNDKQTARFTNSDSFRGKPASANEHAGFIGIVMRAGSVALRNLEATAQPPAEAPHAEVAGEQSAQPHG